MRRRETRYPATISACVSESLRARLETLADQEGVSLGIVIRLCLEAGITRIERGDGFDLQDVMSAARSWWEGLDREDRAAWQVRLPEFKGRELIAVAWLRGAE